MKKASEDVITAEPDLTRWDTVRHVTHLLLGLVLGWAGLMNRLLGMVIVERLVLRVLKPFLKLLIMVWERMGIS